MPGVTELDSVWNGRGVHRVEPAVVYTSNGMNGSVVGSSGTTYRQTEGFTLETQHFPDSPNKPNFPTTQLKPGQDFRSTTIFRFATDAPLPPLPH